MNVFVWAVLAAVLVVPGTAMAQSSGGGVAAGALAAGAQLAVPQRAVVPQQVAVQAPAAAPSLGRQRAGG